jgi:hypothetical protein
MVPENKAYDSYSRFFHALDAPVKKLGDDERLIGMQVGGKVEAPVDLVYLVLLESL